MNQTKEELIAENESLRATIKDLEQQLLAKNAVLSSSAEPGWLISCRNTTYSGKSAGIVFVGGRAFIPESRPDAKKIVELLMSDFGYEAKQMTAAEYKALGEAMPAEMSIQEKLALAGVSGRIGG
jgi:hypothetical protein